MEMNMVTSVVAEQNGVEVEDYINNDGNSFGGERCGICMDIIIDRGVLDCCQHWFCFGCIDNWATITNLCPLCQNEFQMITCVPVYDTIGSSKADDDSYSRDDDWFVEGKNNTLSFPSYYIDENAVICLDGDGCKIRNGSASTVGDPNLDTSIACDSCDLWYHAFCVGFDPEGTSENTWICPRCTDETPQNSDGNFVHNYNNPTGFGNPSRELLAEETYSGNVSISVADSGETAIVVSMISGNKFTEEPLDNTAQTVTSTSEDDDQKLAKPSEGTSATQLISTTQELDLSLSCDTSRSFPSKCLVKNELVTSANESINDHCSSGTGLHLCLTTGSLSSGDEVNKSVTQEGQSDERMKQHNPSEECKSEVEKYLPEVCEDGPETTGVKRKHSNFSVVTETEAVYEVSPKKPRAEESPRPFSPKDQVNVSASSNDLEISSQETVPSNEKTDIMSIVQGTKRRSSKGPKRTITDDKSSKDENLAGLRVKKIMKRAGEDKDSLTLVQNLRKEIREAVRNKNVKDLGENLFDPKLLAAFRAAVAGPKTESVKMLSQMGVKAKKSMLQKGKVRENLTKKIYSSSNGRRKRAWDRDCEVEFWKHRCMRASKPEKIQTLKSVLDLLRNNSEGGMETGQRSERQASDPILSRLYLADTSVFPRKDDIKPLAILKNSGASELSNKQPPLVVVHSNKQAEGSSVSSLNSAKSNARKETSSVKSTDIKVDKRKWALEVLARRVGCSSDSSAGERLGANDGLNGNYPLLARLPVEMRPVLAPSRHNKIPMSVRQTQLYRLTEHLLRKANLPVIRRTAETELAVADAINIERKVADRSNSKPVYMNLCSQELSHHSENSKFREVQENDSLVPSTTDPAEKSEQSENEQITDPTVEEALRNASLLSDSPPNSPNRGTDVEPLTNTKEEEEGPEDVFEMDNVPDLDIYGEFEYSLDDEDYIGVSTTSQLPKAVQLEESASKMKLVFSTLINSDGPSNTPDSDEPVSFENANVKTENQTDAKGETDSCLVPHESLYGKEGEDPCITECEELYGPDTEPLANKLPVKLDEFNDKSVSFVHSSVAGETSPNHSETGETVQKKERKSSAGNVKQSENSISKKVEAYIKEHIRPLCKSGIITVEQYRWAVAKTSEKVMKYHSKAKNANFLIKEGEKVKKLAEQYVESAQHREKR